MNGSSLEPSDLTPLVELADLTVEFGGVQVVKGVSLAVRPGECVALVGHVVDLGRAEH